MPITLVRAADDDAQGGLGLYDFVAQSVVPLIDGLAGAAPAIALLLSASALIIANHSQKRSRFMELHELLTALNSQEGRRLLLQRGGPETPAELDRLFKKEPLQFDKINRAIGLYNTLAIYAHEKYLPRKQALVHWGPAIRGSWPRIEIFVRWRRAGSPDGEMWSHLVWFAELAGAEVSPDMQRVRGRRTWRYVGRLPGILSARQPDSVARGHGIDAVGGVPSAGGISARAPRPLRRSASRR